jgi:nitroreductase
MLAGRAGMDVVEALRKRKSIRGFKPDPVPREVLGKVLEAACRAPSALNTQPWEFFVVGGEALREVCRENVRLLRSGAPLELEVAESAFPKDSVYRKRQVELAKQLFRLMGIAREDEEKRAAWTERGFRHFDAPAAIVIVQDGSLTGDGPLFDMGSITQSICLAALNFGLGTCIARQGVFYPAVLRKVVGIPESKRIVIAIAIGYPDWDFPANAVETDREDLEAITTWVGFD